MNVQIIIVKKSQELYESVFYRRKFGSVGMFLWGFSAEWEYVEEKEERRSAAN